MRFDCSRVGDRRGQSLPPLDCSLRQGTLAGHDADEFAITTCGQRQRGILDLERYYAEIGMKRDWQEEQDESYSGIRVDQAHRSALREKEERGRRRGVHLFR